MYIVLSQGGQLKLQKLIEVPIEIEWEQDLMERIIVRQRIIQQAIDDVKNMGVISGLEPYEITIVLSSKLNYVDLEDELFETNTNGTNKK